MENPDDLQRELELSRAIAAQRDRLVRTANRTVLLLAPRTRRLFAFLASTETSVLALKENQIRNVVNVAGSAGSIEALLNFIRYQIARESAWREKNVSQELDRQRAELIHRGVLPGDYGQRDFGHQVIEDIQGEVRAAAVRAIALLRRPLAGAADDPALLDQIERRLAEEYLGYLNRAFYYCVKVEGGHGALETIVTRKEPGNATL